MIDRYVKYFGCAAILLAVIALVGCGQEEPASPATSEPTAAVQPSPEAMEATAAPTTTEATAMDNQGVSRLQTVRDRGTLICSSNNSLAGFGFLDSGGNTVGFDIDLCRAVAAAVLGNPDAVEFRPTTAAERGPAIQSGEVDIMSRNTTWTSSRDAAWGNFAQTMFFDGQGFMIPKSLGVTSMMELRDAKICVQQGTTTELNIQDFDNQNAMNFDILTFPDNVSSNEAYISGQCDSLTTDRSGLVSTRAGFDNPDDHTILPGTISEEPLGPVVPHGDDQWYDVVKTVMAILIYAEAYGVTSDSVPAAATGNTKVDRLMGLEGSFGQEALGLSNTVAQDVIRGVGNYGEIYDRHLIPLGLERDGSRNALWANAPCADCPRGGQIYAAPLR
ncbi:MAG: amino acid ABC transporter substrate-binding protein [Chloroflexi bacterium]|nr:amino acid ABC transporter substrate-binding protein [Chloroflexota bacterium]